MQARWIAVALSTGLAVAGFLAVAGLAAPALAQSLDGPLAAPDAAPAATKAPATHIKPKPRKAHHAAAKTTKVPADAAVPSPTSAQAPAQKAAQGGAAPGDAVDLGMKWNGTSDGSAQTRFQNGPANAFGSGAEVGMKLHF